MQSVIKNLPGLLEMGKHFLTFTLKPASTVLDMTVGNGHDSLFLARLVGPQGKVFGFDIQKQAILNAQNLLATHRGIADVKLFLAGHERFSGLLPAELKGHISGAVFNLGYLPGSDKEIITRPETTLPALNELLYWLKPGGIISVHIYTGHPGGKEESEAIMSWAKALPRHDWDAGVYELLNKPKNREILLLLLKRHKDEISAQLR